MKEKLKETYKIVATISLGVIAGLFFAVGETPESTTCEYRQGYEEGYHKACEDIALMEQTPLAQH